MPEWGNFFSLISFYENWRDRIWGDFWHICNVRAKVFFFYDLGCGQSRGAFFVPFQPERNKNVMTLKVSKKIGGIKVWTCQNISGKFGRSILYRSNFMNDQSWSKFYARDSIYGQKSIAKKLWCKNFRKKLPRWKYGPIPTYVQILAGIFYPVPFLDASRFGQNFSMRFHPPNPMRAM